MGIEEFKTKGVRTYKEGSTSKGRRLEDEEDAIEALKQIKDIIGEYPTADQWERHKRKIGVTTTASRFEIDTGKTFRSIKNQIDEIERITNSGKLNILLEDINIDKSADYYIYVLRCIRLSDKEVYYYVGSSKELESRLLQHIRYGGDFSAPIPDEGKEYIVDNYEFSYEIESVYDVKEIYEESDEENFQKRILELERRKSYEVSLTENTVNVLGGA